MDRVRQALRPSTKHGCVAGKKQHASHAPQQVRFSGTRRVRPPKTHKELKTLAHMISDNHIDAIKQLQDELKRLSGRVIIEDHKQAQKSELMRYIQSFSLNPAIIKQELIDDASSSSSSSE